MPEKPEEIAVQIGEHVMRIDREDYERLSLERTPISVRVLPKAGKQYAAVRITGELIHRLITGVKGRKQVDHIDGNGLNNTRANLRVCSGQQNRCNSKGRRVRINDYKGIFKANKKFAAHIIWSGRKHYLGVYGTQEAAGEAYDKAAIVLHGRFACLNFPEKRGEYRISKNMRETLLADGAGTPLKKPEKEDSPPKPVLVRNPIRNRKIKSVSRYFSLRPVEPGDLAWREPQTA